MQWLTDRIRGLFGTPQPPSNLLVGSVSPLSDAECEAFFFQMLEGVDGGWTSGDVQRFFAALADRADDTRWNSWLKHLDARLDTGEILPAPIPQRLIRFGEETSGSLAERALEVGRKASDRVPSPESTPVDTVDVVDSISAVNAVSAADTDAEDIEADEPPNPEISSSKPRDLAAELQAWLDRGKTQIERKKLMSALLAFDMAIAVDQNSRDAWMYRGDTLADLKRPRNATKCYERALQIAPDAATLWSRLGDVQYDLKRYALAIQSWKRAVTLDPNDAQAWANQGIALGLGLGNWPDAIACWTQASKIEPQSPDIWFRLGVGYGAQSQWETAIENWDKALEFDPTLKDALTNKAIALKKLDRLEEAAAVEAHIRDLEAGTAIASSAASVVDPETSETPTDPVVEAKEFFQRGVEQYEQKNYQAAQRFFERASTHYPEPLSLWRYQGLALKELDRRAEAIECWDRVLAEKPDDADLLGLKALVLQDLENWDAANATWDRVVELRPDNGNAWIQKGIALQNLGRYDEAIAANNRARDCSQE